MKIKQIKQTISTLLAASILMFGISTTRADVGQQTIKLPSLDEVQAASYCVYDKTTGEIILSSNPDAQIYPASMTKIMTAQLALDYLDTDDMVTVSQNAIDATTSDSTLMGLSVGENVKISELLYGMLLPSGNDAANVLAEATVTAFITNYPANGDNGPDGVNASYLTDKLGMTEDEILSGSLLTAFAELMNLRAQNIGCTGTHFVNANGLHSDSHYTTASDLTKMMANATQNPDFCTVINTPTHVFAATDKHPEDGWSMVRNTNWLLSDPWIAATTPEGEDSHLTAIVGGKTGTTSNAGTGMTLDVFCENGHELCISVCGIPYELAAYQSRYVASVTSSGCLVCWQNDPVTVLQGTTGDYRNGNSTSDEAPQYDPLIHPGDVAPEAEQTSPTDDAQETSQSDETEQASSEKSDNSSESSAKTPAIVLFTKTHPVESIAAGFLILLILFFVTILIIRNVNRRNRRKRKVRPYRGENTFGK